MISRCVGRAGEVSARTWLTRPGIRDFTENGTAARPGGRRNVGRAVVKGLVGKQGEGQSFLGLFGNTKARGGKHFDRAGRAQVRPAEALGSGTQGREKLSEQKRVASATTGDDELVDFCLWQDETVERINYGKRRENSRGADQIDGPRAMSPA